MAANVAGSDSKTPAIIQTPHEHSPAPARTTPNATNLIRVLRRALHTNAAKVNLFGGIIASGVKNLSRPLTGLKGSPALASNSQNIRSV